MKKFVSLIFAIAAVFLLSITAFGAEVPFRLFSVSSEDDFSPEEVYSFAIEKGFSGVLLDLRKTDSMDLYSDFISAANGIEYFEIYALVNENNLKELKPGNCVVFSDEISEETIAEYSAASGSEGLSFLVPFGDEKALEKAEYLFGKGYFKTLFVENLLSCHSENGYEEYLLEISEKFSGAEDFEKAIAELRRIQNEEEKEMQMGQSMLSQTSELSQESESSHETESSHPVELS